MTSSATIDSIEYTLNKDNKTASVKCVQMREIKTDFIIIPRSINYESIEYVVTKINKDAFSLNQILKFIQFSDDSEIQVIEENAFELSSIEQFIVPPSLTEFTTKSFFLTTKLSKITVMPGNPIFISIDDKMICKKSSIEKVDYDYLFFCVQNIERVTIPSFIEIIGSYSLAYCCLQSIEIPPDSKLRIFEKNAFTSTRIKSIKIPPHLTTICEYAFSYCVCLCEVDIPDNSELRIIEKSVFTNCLSLEKFTVPPHLTTICESTFHTCTKLQEIVIPNNSELRTIKKRAFDSSSVKTIKIPKSLVDLQDGWCCNAFNLTSVIVTDNNPRYIMYENKFILGKSSIENEDYDSLVFCFRNIENKVKLPNFIKIIEPNAFECCTLQILEISADSKLQMIGNGAFYGSLIKCFSFPINIKKISIEAFSSCKKLRFVDIPKKSELQIIEESAFYLSSINYIFIPYQVTQISANCFSYSKLRQIDFADNSKRFERNCNTN